MSIHGQNKKPLQKREVLSLYMQDFPSLISQNKFVLQDLAPIPMRNGCWAFIGPVPLPLLIRECSYKISVLNDTPTLMRYYHNVNSISNFFNP